MAYRIRLLNKEEDWAMSGLGLPGCHLQGNSREEALRNSERPSAAGWTTALAV